MKKYLGTGLITLLPLALTIMIVSWLFGIVSGPLLGITEYLLENVAHVDMQQHRTLVVFLSRLLAFVSLLVITFLLGFFGRKFFFKSLINFTNHLLMRTPFIRKIYRISKEVTSAALSQEAKPFKKTVLIPFPHSEVHTLGFLTGDVPSICKKVCPNMDHSVFVPTSPPLSGYMVFSPKNILVDVPISVEDTLKYLISCGTAHPGEKPTQEETKKP